MVLAKNIVTYKEKFVVNEIGEIMAIDAYKALNIRDHKCRIYGGKKYEMYGSHDGIDVYVNNVHHTEIKITGVKKVTLNNKYVAVLTARSNSDEYVITLFSIDGTLLKSRAIDFAIKQMFLIGEILCFENDNGQIGVWSNAKILYILNDYVIDVNGFITVNDNSVEVLTIKDIGAFASTTNFVPLIIFEKNES